jgi:hypothetical protein
MTMQICGSLLFAIQLFMLGALTGAVLDVVSFIRTFIFSKREKKKWAQSPFWLIFFVCVMITTGILTWDTYVSIFAIMGTLLSTFALWMKNPKYIRIISLFVGPCWITYNAIIGSVPGILNEVVAMTSIIVGLILYDIRKKPVVNDENKLEENSEEKSKATEI